MRNFTTKQLIYMSFYYFWVLFLVACILFDITQHALSGFTFGYAAALLYFIARTRSVMRLMESEDDNRSKD